MFLMSDDQSCYSMGCYGNQDVQTPNLDQLAADGLVFNNHYDTTAICMASRASVMTGMFEYKTGCNFSHGPLTREKWERSYPVLLRSAGYRIAFAGKFGFEVVSDAESNDPSLPSGDFDRWGGGPGQTSYETVKNRSMAQYAKEYPHSTLSYGTFGRDFINEAADGGQAVLSVNQFQSTSPACDSRSGSSTIFMPDKPSRSPPTLDANMDSISPNRVDRDVNLSGSTPGIILMTTTQLWRPIINRYMRST